MKDVIKVKDHTSYGSHLTPRAIGITSQVTSPNWCKVEAWKFISSLIGAMKIAASSIYRDVRIVGTLTRIL
jgi:hypothetical protein